MTEPQHVMAKITRWNGEPVRDHKYTLSTMEKVKKVLGKSGGPGQATILIRLVELEKKEKRS